MKWKQKDGKIIYVKDMSSNHLQNSIRMFERVLEKDPGEQVYIGDNDISAQAVEMENEHNAELRESIKSQLKGLKKELESRK